MSQQIPEDTIDTTNSGHVNTTTSRVVAQASTSAPPPATLSDQAPSSSAPDSNQRIIAPSQSLLPTAGRRGEGALHSTSATVTSSQDRSQPTQASQSSTATNNTSGPLIWIEASTPSQLPHNIIASSSSTSESSSRALQPLSLNTRNSVPQRQAFVEGYGEEDESEGRAPKRQRGEGDVDAGESSSGVNMLS
jgi:hypothetical protein